jgi:hypothetical protein
MVHAQIQRCDVIQCHHKPRQISNAVITRMRDLNCVNVEHLGNAKSNTEKALQAKLMDTTLDATQCSPGQSCSSRKFSLHAPSSGYASRMKFRAAVEFSIICQGRVNA